MINRLLASTQSTQSMTGRLALFFSFVSVVIGIFCFLLITGSLLWSEDRVGERRIMVDKKKRLNISSPTQSKAVFSLTCSPLHTTTSHWLPSATKNT